MVVVRQNFSRGPKRGGSGGVGVNTIIDSVQQEDPRFSNPAVPKPYPIVMSGLTGTSCTTPLEICFCDIDKLSFRKPQWREDRLLSKGCGSFGHLASPDAQLNSARDYPLRSCDVRALCKWIPWTIIRRRADLGRLLLRGLVSIHRKTRLPKTYRI